VIESKFLGFLIVLMLTGTVTFATMVTYSSSPRLSREILMAKLIGAERASAAKEKARKFLVEEQQRLRDAQRDAHLKELDREIDERDALIEDCEKRGLVPTIGFDFDVVCVKAHCVEKPR